jgi:hypothetical protein
MLEVTFSEKKNKDAFSLSIWGFIGGGNQKNIRYLNK